MKGVFSLVLCLFFLVGCSAAKEDMNQALALRSQIQQANACTFSLQITADYGNATYDFAMDCVSDRQGNVTFTVTAPESISGITGNLANGNGSLTFDDTVLAIPMLTNEKITPISAPWLLMRTLRGGCITSCAEGRVTIDDSYADDALTLDIYLDGTGKPKTVDIYWKNSRILALKVTSFVLS